MKEYPVAILLRVVNVYIFVGTMNFILESFNKKMLNIALFEAITNKNYGH